MLVNRSLTSFKLIVMLSVLKIGVIFATGIVFTETPLHYFRSLSTILDLLVILPFLALFPIPGARFVYVPYYLNCFLLIPHLKLIIRYKRMTNPFGLTVFLEKLIMLVANIWTLVYFGVASFNYFETRFDKYFLVSPNSLSLVDTFYFIVITFATVGYGDISPKTEMGKIIIIILILAAIAILPGLISDLMLAIVDNSNGGGIFHPTSGSEFVVISGEFVNGIRAIEMIDALIKRVNKY